MSTTLVPQRGVVRFGALQARTEVINRFTRPSALGYLILPAVLVTIFSTVDVGSALGSAAGMLAGITTAALFVGGFVGIAGELVAEQDDGTMLRVRTLPFGLSGYLVGKSMSLLVSSLVTVLLVLIPAHLLVTHIVPTDAPGALAFLGLAVLSLFASVPIGSVLGATLKSPLAIMPVSLVAYALMAVSGVFFPVSVLPDWLEATVKFFPVYWLGLLGRVILVPEVYSADAGEIALAIGVPLIWGIVGLALAPRALRVMTRRQSGSRLEALAARRQARGY